MKTNTYSSINETLGTSYVKQEDEVIVLEPQKESKSTVTAAIALVKDYKITVAETKEIIHSNFNEDYDYIRTTLRNLMASGMDALETATELAAATESPRCMEVCTSIITTIAGLGKELTTLHKDALKMVSEGTEPSTGIVAETVNNIQNNYYEPTQKELHKILDEVVEVVYDDADLV